MKVTLLFRVVECRLAAVVLACKLNIDWKTIRKLGEVQQKSNKSLAEMVSEYTL